MPPLPRAYSSSSLWVLSGFPDLSLLCLWPEGSPWQWGLCWLLPWYIGQQASGDRPCLLGYWACRKGLRELVGVGGMEVSLSLHCWGLSSKRRRGNGTALGVGLLGEERAPGLA